MAEAEVVEQDPVLVGLAGLLKEFETHKKRIGARSRALTVMKGNGELKDEVLAAAVVELFEELHDTALSIQEDLTRICLTAFNDEGADEDDDEDDGEDEVDVDVDSQLLPGDAATIKRSLSDFHNMLTGMLQHTGLALAEKNQLEASKELCDTALELVAEITIEDGEATEEDDDDEAPSTADALVNPKPQN